LLPGGKMGVELCSGGGWQDVRRCMFVFEIKGRAFFFVQNMPMNRWCIYELRGRFGLKKDTTDAGTWPYYSYAVLLPFVKEGKTYFYGQDRTQKRWFIRELLQNGTMGAETGSGRWENDDECRFVYQINGTYLLCHDDKSKRWFIRDTSGYEIQSGRWGNSYPVMFPFTRNGRQFFYSHNITKKKWFIQELNNPY
jgi:hypothetical protein